MPNLKQCEPNLNTFELQCRSAQLAYPNLYLCLLKVPEVRSMNSFWTGDLVLERWIGKIG